MRINVEYSTQHWIFPIITIGILVILGVLLIALEGRARIKAGKGFFVKPGRFFVEHYDKFKFWGTIALMVVYFFLLDKLGFTFWSIICLFLFNTLFANKAAKHTEPQWTQVYADAVQKIINRITTGDLSK